MARLSLGKLKWPLIFGAMLVLSYIGDLLVVGFFLGLAMLGFLGARSSLAQVRIMADTPTATIRGASQGRVELKARIPVDEPLVAPFSEEPCCFWHLTAERQFGPRGRTYWKEVGKACSGYDWLELDDGTGQCLLPLPEATIKSQKVIKHDFGEPGMSGLGKWFDKDTRDAMARYGPKRIIETRFDVDAQLYAIGLFQSLPSNTTPFDDDWARRIVRQGAAAPGWASKLAKMAIAAGETGRQEMMEKWRARMRVLEGIGPDAPLAGSATVHTLRQDQRQGRMFPLILSDKDERGVIASVRRNVAISIGFMIAMLGSAVAAFAYTRPDWFRALIDYFS